jgi:diguanylate cyclase (GGDEF)-like protein/PAS domain S-box-containing protein
MIGDTGEKEDEGFGREPRPRLETAMAQKRDARKKYLSSLAHQLPDATIVLTRDGFIDFSNSATEAVLGLAPKGLAGRAIEDFVHPEDWSPLRAELDRSALQKLAIPSLRFRFRRGDGAWLHLEGYAGPLVQDSTASHTILTVRPATQPGEERKVFGLYKAVLEQTEESVIITDREGVVAFANRSFENSSGLSRTEVLGKNVNTLQSSYYQEDYFAKFKEVLADRGTFHGVVSTRKKDGSPHFEEINIAPLAADPDEAGHLISIAQDITHRMLVEEELRASKERFALSAQGANDGLWDWDMVAGTVYFSPRFEMLLGLSEGELGGTLDDWFSWIHPEDVEEFKLKIMAHREGLSPHFEHEHRMLHKDGGCRWMVTRGLAVRGAEGKAYRMAGSQTDVTIRKRAEEQALYDAFHDGLTGLPNRALFMDRLGQSLARAKRKDTQRLAVLFMDLDRFKIINDSLGHMVGDQLLVEIAKRLETSLRPADTVARLGGDEFAILLEDIEDLRDATSFAERIQKDIRDPFEIDGREVFTTASIGIAVSGPSYERPEDLIRDADTAMYRAKSLGKARYALFDKAMHASALALLQLETDLRRAVEGGNFRLVYQPIVSIKGARTAGFEALVRWMHPKRGIVSPTEFIPLAEETGLIIPIGQWILREAFRQLRVWQGRFRQSPPLIISVNLSGVQFLRPELIGQIDLMLREFGIDARNLKLEITESMIIENAEYAKDMLLQFKAQDIRLCIDDFGTGYSSMSYLRRYPIDTVKVDRSFISRMDTDQESQEIVRTIITMAHNLGKDVIAEGVETREQLVQIAALRCEYAQGFFFSRPVDSEAAEMMIRKRWTW